MYSVTANLVCEEYGDYIAHWNGGDFEDYDEAYKKWDEWWPDEEEVRKACEENDEEEGCECGYSLQIGLWDEDGNDLELIDEII